MCVDILCSQHLEEACPKVDKGGESTVREEIMCAEINGNCGELVLLMVAVSCARPNEKLLVDKSLVEIIGPYEPLAESTQTRPSSNFNQIQATFP